MLRIILTVLVATILGFAIGKLQSSASQSGVEERFRDAKPGSLELLGGDASNANAGVPRIEVVGGTEYKFGSMLHGATESHDFVVRNLGDAPLKLNITGSTCKCTVGELEKSLLPPGEETTVSMTWTAQSVRVDFGQSATLETNDPLNSELKLTVRGKIADSFVMQPQELNLGDIPRSEGLTTSFFVFAYIDDAEELRDLTWTNTRAKDKVDLEYKKIPIDSEKFPKHADAKSAFEVTVTLEPGMPLGSIGSRIQFRTNKEEKIGTLDVTAIGRVVGDVAIFGGSAYDPKLATLKLGNVKSSDGASATLMLSIQGEAKESIKPEISSVEPSQSLKVFFGEPKDMGNRKIYPITFEVPVGAPLAYFPGTASDNFGKVVIKTNSETEDEIPIFVRLVVVE